MGFARARPPDRHPVLRGIRKLHRGKLVDRQPVHFGLPEVKPRQIPMDWKLGGTRLITNRPYAPVSQDETTVLLLRTKDISCTLVLPLPKTQQDT